MADKGDLAVQILNQKGGGGRLSGFAQFFDIKKAFDDATRKHQFEMELQQQQGRNSVASQGVSNYQLSPQEADSYMQTGQVPEQQPIPSGAANAATGAEGEAGELPFGYMNFQGKVIKVSPQMASLAETRDNLRLDRIQKQAETQLTKALSGNGSLSVQNKKVDQAVHLRTMFNQAYDPLNKTYNLGPAQYEEVAIGLANLVSGSSVTSESMREGVRTRTAKGDWLGAITYFSGSPKNASTQEIFKNLKESIDRQGLAAQDLRDKEKEKLTAYYSKRLPQDRAEDLKLLNLGHDYNEFIQNSPDYQAEQVGSALTGGNKQSENRVGKYTFQ